MARFLLFASLGLLLAMVVVDAQLRTFRGRRTRDSSEENIRGSIRFVRPRTQSSSRNIGFIPASRPRPQPTPQPQPYISYIPYSYKYKVEDPNELLFIEAEEERSDSSARVDGGYQWMDAEGNIHQTTYYADETGYHPTYTVLTGQASNIFGK